MPLSDPKFLSVLKNFGTLSASASEVNKASSELASAVSHLDEMLKRLNLGITGWVVIRSRNAEPPQYDDYELGYARVNSKWGLAIRRIHGDPDHEDVEGPWAFSDAKRELRIGAVDKIPELLEKLAQKAADTAEQLTEKTREVLKYSSAIESVAAAKTELKPLAPPPPPPPLPNTPPLPYALPLPYTPKAIDPLPAPPAAAPPPYKRAINPPPPYIPQGGK
jgi:hypothetical protein